MRKYQEEIYSAIINKGDWAGSNVVVTTKDNVTNVYFYGSLIGVVDHNKKTVKYDNCGYNNACTTARINAVKMAAENYYGYGEE